MIPSDIISLIGVILSFALIFFLVYNGMHVVLATLFASCLLIATNHMGLFDSIDILFQGWGEAIPLFGGMIVFSAIFSKIMEYTGAARSFAMTIYGKLLPKRLSLTKRRNWTIIITIVLEVILVYAGIDLFALTFMMLPILGSVCQELNMSRKFIPALILAAAGIANAMPGTTGLCNVIPMQLLDTSPMAGTFPGFVGAAVVIFGICIHLCRASKKSAEKGETFEWGPVLTPYSDNDRLPPFWLSILPLIAVIIGFNVLKIKAYTLVLASLVAIIVLYKYIPIKNNRKNELEGKAFGVYDLIVKGLGAVAPLLLVFFTTGFATLISNSRGYEILLNEVLKINIDPAITYGLIACILVGIMINPIGAIMITIPFAISAFPDLSHAAIHRISTYAFIVFDSLPFASGIILAQDLAGLTAKQSYKPIFYTTVVWAFVGLAVVVAMFVINPNWA